MGPTDSVGDLDIRWYLNLAPTQTSIRKEWRTGNGDDHHAWSPVWQVKVLEG